MHVPQFNLTCASVTPVKWSFFRVLTQVIRLLRSYVARLRRSSKLAVTLVSTHTLLQSPVQVLPTNVTSTSTTVLAPVLVPVPLPVLVFCTTVPVPDYQY
jgi:hypothetical protein